MKRNIFTAAAIGALLLLNSAVPVCSAAPYETLNDEGVAYVMGGFKGYYLEDGVYYLKQTTNEFGKPIKGADEYGAAEVIPPGEYYASLKLQALSATYPEGKFAVRFRADDGSKMLSEPESEATLKELDRLRNAGVDADIIQETPETAYSTYIFAVLTADQINNFPVSEEFGYRLALSEKPEGSYDSSKLHAEDDSQKKGDVNGDKVIDVGDLSYLSLYLLGDKPLPEEWLKAADVDGDGDVTIADLARLRQYLSKKIDSLTDDKDADTVVQEKEVKYSAAISVRVTDNKLDEYPQHSIIEDRAGFEALYNEKQSLEIEKTGFYSGGIFPILNDKYTDEWFETHKLYVAYPGKGGPTGYRYNVESVTNKAVTIHWDQLGESQSRTENKADWIIFIEVSKDADVTDATEIKFNTVF